MDPYKEFVMKKSISTLGGTLALFLFAINATGGPNELVVTDEIMDQPEKYSPLKIRNARRRDYFPSSAR